MKGKIKIIIFVLFALQGSLLYADEISPEELERWFNSDTLEPPRYKEVNDGHLVFLTASPKKNLHHHHNTLVISSSSLDNGWIQIKQCHTNIDKVAEAQIVFKQHRIRDIKITKAVNIDKVWVEGASVQIQGVKANARLCVEAYSNSLVHLKDGSYSIRNGPFMRRFLDGYFPLRVTMELDFSDTGLELVTYQPPTQEGFSVVEEHGKLKFDTIFEGQLLTEFQFRKHSL